MKLLMIIAAIVSICFSANIVSAQANRSLQDEKIRIRQGVKSGELTHKEAAGLRRQSARLKTNAIRYKTDDGRINRNERADLRRDNRRLNRNIYHQKRDRQKRI